MEHEKVTKIANYQAVASVLTRCINYKNVGQIANETLLSDKKVRASIKLAKDHLSKRGVIICNKMGTGYRVGNYLDLEIECAKSVLRSYAVLKSNLKRATAIKNSGVAGDYDRIKSTLSHNILSLKYIFRARDEFESDEEYQEYLDQMKITPEFLNDIANEDYE